ncbi:ParB/RepB/Spo0J family partition protein [Falsiruegeria mediterranea]|jgi:ParB/Sulfiredoxin domain|uniref:Nucleoid occlusion protein n=1 Tax=Falsiruegeria mediterranea M17 TaxID=1200281 RepID=A0A2R8CDV9_9RHOB|nr:ParB N-terminal domain-containing protein [Falsiruegeria mediterranea]SPJ30595.1 Nucleoid occlusion protein [Falsiruegeria mediterranea M17]
MAKRRRLTAPDADTLRELDEGFAAKPVDALSLTPPIAQVAGEAAALAGMTSVTDRAEQARDAADAQQFRQAKSAGLVAQPIALDLIEADFIRRDRLNEDPEAMEELLTSIRSSGLRSPIEVAALPDGFGLISGYRRLKAFQVLATEDPKFGMIPAYVRDADAGQDAYVSMVEENEVRANLTPYERGRIAVLSTGQGVFSTVSDAVDVLFASVSKAKRSKVRSFALVHECLGDLLRYPSTLTEKAGLQLAAALREGAQADLRVALDSSDCTSSAEEWTVLSKVLANRGRAEKDPSKGGRPSSNVRLPLVQVEDGAELRGELSANGFRIELFGRKVDPTTGEIILREIRRILEDKD